MPIHAPDSRLTRPASGQRQRIAKKDQPRIYSRPADLSWLVHLPAHEYATFESEMNKALKRKDWTELSELLISWRSTALIYADPPLAKKLSRPLGNDLGRLPRPS